MIYFLHPCSAVTARWLRDTDIDLQRIEAYNLLSTAAQMIVCEQSYVLLDPKNNCDAVMLGWVLESVWHFCWLLQYWEELCTIANRVQWKESAEFKCYLEKFPRNEFRMLDCEQMRADYGAKRGVYKRNKPPFWVSRAREVPAMFAQDTEEEDFFS